MTAAEAVNKQEAARSVTTRLKKHGYDAYFVGGFVRDLIMGNTGDSDIDIATSAQPAEITRLFPRTVNVGEHFGVIIVQESGFSFEVATFREDDESSDGRHPDAVLFSDPPSDARRRDFTINGLFFDPGTDEIIDYVGGRADIAQRVIRTIGDPDKRFQEDYLRLLRAIRFASRFDFTIEPQTWDAIRNHSPMIVRISVERIFQELTKMLTGPQPDRAISLLEESGLLHEVLPEVDALKGIEQPPEFHPEGDVFVHTIKTLAMLRTPTPVAAWSGLLHDIGKATTGQRCGDRIRFNNHHHAGAEMARAILTRLKSPKAFGTAVTECVLNHMNFINVQKMRLSTLKRFLSRPTIDDEIELHRADCLASHGNIDNYLFCIEKLRDHSRTTLMPQPFIRGQDLIAAGFSPGPLFGTIIRRVYDLQLDEQLKSRDEAIAWIQSHRVELGSPTTAQQADP